jgi:hypothetical protein
MLRGQQQNLFTKPLYIHLSLINRGIYRLYLFEVYPVQ